MCLASLVIQSKEQPLTVRKGLKTGEVRWLIQIQYSHGYTEYSTGLQFSQSLRFTDHVTWLSEAYMMSTTIYHLAPVFHCCLLLFHTSSLLFHSVCQFPLWLCKGHWSSFCLEVSSSLLSLHSCYLPFICHHIAVQTRTQHHTALWKNIAPPTYNLYQISPINAIDLTMSHDCT